MLRIACATAAAFALAATGCKRERSTEPGAAPSAGSAAEKSEAKTAGAVDPRIAALPGELWFLEDGEAHALVRLRKGERLAVEGELYPSRTRLPDGRVVAISSKGDGSPDSEQLVLVADDGTLTPVGPTAAKVRDPIAVSGTSIVATREVEGVTNLFALDVASGEVAQLTDDPQGNFRPASLGGDQIVFVSSRDGDAELYRGSARGGEVQRLTTFHKDDFEPVPSPDGTTIAFQSDREGIAPRLFLVKPDGTELRRLTQLPSDAPEEEVEAAWSPDGKLLAYIRREGGEAVLVLHEVASGAERVLTPAGLADAEPAFSPDGAWIAVARGKAGGLGKTDVWAIPVAGGEPVQVTTGAGTERLPRWF